MPHLVRDGGVSQDGGLSVLKRGQSQANWHDDSPSRWMFFICGDTEPFHYLATSSPAQGPRSQSQSWASNPGRMPDSLCGKSSALKTFRQKWAPRRATPVGLSRLFSMSSLSSEGSFLSSYKQPNMIPQEFVSTIFSHLQPTPLNGAF